MQLEGVLHKLDRVHEDFRLWITTEPHLAFPIGLLQMSIKVTNEAPVGMKAGLRASFQWITQVSTPFDLQEARWRGTLQCLPIWHAEQHETKPHSAKPVRLVMP